MSGGAFEYQEMHLSYIADKIDDELMTGNHDEVGDILEAASDLSRKLRKLLKAVDYYLEQDTDEKDLIEAFDEYSE